MMKGTRHGLRGWLKHYWHGWCVRYLYFHHSFMAERELREEERGNAAGVVRAEFPKNSLRVAPLSTGKGAGDNSAQH